MAMLALADLEMHDGDRMHNIVKFLVNFVGACSCGSEAVEVLRVGSRDTHDAVIYCCECDRMVLGDIFDAVDEWEDAT